jgi:tetratricopeptide (TPR) repeat protein
MHSSPSSADRFQAAVRAFQSRDWPQTEALCREVLASDPKHTDALHMLGLVFKETGRLGEAIAALQNALAQQPSNAVLWTNLGVIYHKAEQSQQAVECQLEAIALQGNLPEAHFNLALAYRGLGQSESAIAAVSRATALRPRYPAAQYLLGNLLREEGRLTEAVDAYRLAIQLRPDWSAAHQNLAAAWLALRRPAEALAHYQQVLRLETENADALYAMGQALTMLGRIAEAKVAYERAAAGAAARPCYRDSMSVLFRESLAETIAPDRAAIDDYKARVLQALDAFAADPGKIDVSKIHTHANATPSPMLPYFGGNVRPIMERYAQALGPQIPVFSLGPRAGKPKLGIVVTGGSEGVFSRCWGGIAERLSRELFEVRLVCAREGANVLQGMIHVPEQEYVLLPRAGDEAARTLADQEFDWLHYWEIGTGWMNYFLPFFRAAPGQSGGWGWPVTSGNPQVTSYLSCEQLEPPGAPAHYSEHLILLERLPTYYVPTAVWNESSVRERFGLREGQHVYLCTQKPIKHHPDIDPLLAGILRNDGRGELLIIGDRQESITELLFARFRRTIPGGRGARHAALRRRGEYGLRRSRGRHTDRDHARRVPPFALGSGGQPPIGAPATDRQLAGGVRGQGHRSRQQSRPAAGASQADP